MARLTLNALLEGNELGDFYTAETLEVRTERADKAVYLDTDTGNKIIIEGVGFSYDGEMIEKGRVARPSTRRSASACCWCRRRRTCTA